MNQFLNLNIMKVSKIKINKKEAQKQIQEAIRNFMNADF